MKKKPIFLLTAAVLLGCVFGAGCISYEEVQEESEYFRPDIVKQFTN